MADVELVIKIPKAYYENLLKNCSFSSEEIPIVSLAIAAGTQLPKGHGRLIDEKEVKKMIEEAKVNSEHSKTFAENIIKFTTTIIEADRESTDGREYDNNAQRSCQ